MRRRQNLRERIRIVPEKRACEGPRPVRPWNRGPSGRHGTQRAPPLDLREIIGIVPKRTPDRLKTRLTARRPRQPKKTATPISVTDSAPSPIAITTVVHRSIRSMRACWQSYCGNCLPRFWRRSVDCLTDGNWGKGFNLPPGPLMLHVERWIVSISISGSRLSGWLY